MYFYLYFVLLFYPPFDFKCFVFTPFYLCSLIVIFPIIEGQGQISNFLRQSAGEGGEPPPPPSFLKSTVRAAPPLPPPPRPLILLSLLFLPWVWVRGQCLMCIFISHILVPPPQATPGGGAHPSYSYFFLFIHMFRLLNVKRPPLPPRLRPGGREGLILFDMMLCLLILGYPSHYISFLLYMF